MLDFSNYKEQFIYLLSLIISVVLGFIIGYERKSRLKEAGIRTHTIVCAGSCLMTLISKYGFSGDFDGSRIAAQIVTGIGFLGAGIIVYRKNAVHGLTTAAGVWATAGVGMATGAGLYILAAGASIILVAIQYVMHLKYKVFLPKNSYQLNVKFKDSGEESKNVKNIFDVQHFYQLNLERVGETLICDVVISTDVLYSSEKINEIMTNNPYIISIRRIEQ